jgi:hypothetical protein
VCAHPALNDAAHVNTLAGFGRRHSSVTTIAFMYNSRSRACHAGHLLDAVNFLLKPCCLDLPREMSALSPEPATESARPIVFPHPHILCLPQGSSKAKYTAICVQPTVTQRR